MRTTTLRSPIVTMSECRFSGLYRRKIESMRHANSLGVNLTIHLKTGRYQIEKRKGNPRRMRVTLTLSVITPAFSIPPPTFSEAKVQPSRKSTSTSRTVPWASCITAANGRGLANQVVVSMLSHAALRPESKRIGQSERSGNTSFVRGHSKTITAADEALLPKEEKCIHGLTKQ